MRSNCKNWIEFFVLCPAVKLSSVRNYSLSLLHCLVCALRILRKSDFLILPKNATDILWVRFPIIACNNFLFYILKKGIQEKFFPGWGKDGMGQCKKESRLKRNLKFHFLGKYVNPLLNLGYVKVWLSTFSWNYTTGGHLPKIRSDRIYGKPVMQLY